MNKLLRNENGSAIALVLVLFLVFMTLGLALISTTVSGISKGEFRENEINAHYQAEQGLSYFEAYLSSSLNILENIDDLTTDAFNVHLTNFLDQFAEDENYNVTSELGEHYNARISIDQDNIIHLNPGDSDDLSRIIPVLSTGFADGHEKTIETEFLIEAQSTPNQLDYAVGSLNNLALYGAISMVGNVHVEGDLISGDRGQRELGYIPSSFSTIESPVAGEKAEIFVGGNVYKINDSLYTAHWDRLYSGVSYASDEFDDYPNNMHGFHQIQSGQTVGGPRPYIPHDTLHYYTDLSNGDEYKDAFYSHFSENHVPKRVFRSNDVNFTSIDIDGEIEKNRFTNCVGSNCELNGETITVASTPRETFANYTAPPDEHLIATRDIVDLRNSSFYRLHAEGNATIRSGLIESIEGIYTEGDLVIKDTTTAKIKGPIYVEGDLSIENATVEFDSTIYVKGTITISDSSIRGIEATNDAGESYTTSLVAFAKGQITTTRMNFKQNTAETLRAFLYTEDFLSLYGTTSNFQIEGGVFANNITLQGVKGNWHGDNIDSNQSGLRPEDARLRIEYNQELIQNAPKGLPPTVDGNLTIKIQRVTYD